MQWRQLAEQMERERNQAFADLAAAEARADGYALLVGELRAALESISKDLQDDPTGHRVGAALDALLAADPEACAAELLAAAQKAGAP